jgi:hypothetical protein
VGASFIIQRIHLYLALFLTPCMLMYALSTVAMNHRGWFETHYGEQAVQWESVSEARYHNGLTDPSRADVAEEILSHLAISRAHTTRGRLDRRISWSRSDSLLTVERSLSRLPVILESLHHRRGFQHKILTEDLWAVTVDLVILAMIFWQAPDSGYGEKCL